MPTAFESQELAQEHFRFKQHEDQSYAYLSTGECMALGKEEGLGRRFPCTRHQVTRLPAQRGCKAARIDMLQQGAHIALTPASC